MKVHVIPAAWAYLVFLIPCVGEAPSTSKVETPRYFLTIDGLHSVTRDTIRVQVIVDENESFYVSVPGDGVCWTFSGDVGGVVHGHLPILLRMRWYKNAESNSTPESPVLAKINGKGTGPIGAFNSASFALTVRETTDADKLPRSEVMKKALERKIHVLREAQVRPPADNAR